ncbi:MAG: gliding motility-associated C-terminal domain-containing protein [Bacteroidales bacterium]|jgi:gliding motility-associated-like protein
MHRLIVYILLTVFSVCFTYAQPEVQPPELVRVTVDTETGEIHIYWTESPTPGIVYYEVCEWRVTGTGGSQAADPIAQTSELEYSYYNPDVNVKSLGFCIKAYTATDDSPLSSIDSTIFLTVDYDSCSATANLRWNDYNAWRGEIAGYRVCNYTDEGTVEVLETLAEGVNETTITNLEANGYYRFFIIAERDNAEQHTSRSNRVDENTFHAVYPEYIHADFGTVDENNHPRVRFTIDPASELQTYTLVRSSPLTEGPYDSIVTFTTREKVIEYTDDAADASQSPYYYMLQAVNYCDQLIDLSGNAAGTILLNAELEGTTVNLSWNDYYYWPGDVEAYSVEQRYPGETGFSVIAQAGNRYSVSFDNRINQNLGNEVCYRITALEGPGNPIQSVPASSSSNIACVYFAINIEFGFDAFVPGSADNGTFGPSRMDFIPKSFDFKIFNRWGNLVFHSTDPYNHRWDGTYKGGGLVPQGVYRYQLEYDDENGTPKVLHGNVTVVRQ